MADVASAALLVHWEDDEGEPGPRRAQLATVAFVLARGVLDSIPDDHHLSPVSWNTAHSQQHHSLRTPSAAASITANSSIFLV